MFVYSLLIEYMGKLINHTHFVVSAIINPQLCHCAQTLLFELAAKLDFKKPTKSVYFDLTIRSKLTFLFQTIIENNLSFLLFFADLKRKKWG